MCGLYGYVGNKDVDLVSALKSIHHRGPNSNGFWVHDRELYSESTDSDAGLRPGNKVALGFKRLAIIDLNEHSNQPLTDESNQYTIVFNGEIYNYLEIKAELEDEGIVFRTQSDTEVLLASYIRWGTDCFNRFNGMWACIIYDKLSSSVILSRDRFGIKPLYYFQKDNDVHFFSEIKQILELPTFSKEMNENVLRDFLENGVLDASNETFFKGV